MGYAGFPNKNKETWSLTSKKTALSLKECSKLLTKLNHISSLLLSHKDLLFFVYY